MGEPEKLSLVAADGSATDSVTARKLPSNLEAEAAFLGAVLIDNRVIEGELWSAPDLPEISLEQRFAERLGVGVGSVIEFDVQGVPLTLHVTSLRSVEWQSFAINFFIEVEPGVLDRAPALFL